MKRANSCVTARLVEDSGNGVAAARGWWEWVDVHRGSSMDTWLWPGDARCPTSGRRFATWQTFAGWLDSVDDAFFAGRIPRLAGALVNLEVPEVFL